VSVRLVLADDHPIVLAGLVQILETEPDFEVVACTQNGEDALAAVRRERPDVLVLDLSMSGMDGIAVLHEMKRDLNSTAVVVLTAENGPQAVEAVCLGVRGIVLKDMAPLLLVRCIRDVAKGGQWLENRVAGRVIDSLLSRNFKAPGGAHSLTGRQLQIARLVAEGLPSKAIARKLAITEGTAKLHLHNIYEKLEIQGRMALVQYMREQYGV
jgi:DNA-binding NarL/FixJ family response regulator